MYFRIDDAVFICEQQFMATLIQIPRAINRTMFASLNEDSFVAPVFRALFLAIQAAGGLPPDDAPQGLWMHNLNKAGGLTLTTVINELAVLPLPLPPSDQDRRRRIRRAGRCQCGGRAAASGEPRRDPVRRRTVRPSSGHGIHAAHRCGAPAHGRHARRLGKTGTARRNHRNWRPLARTCKRRSTVTPSAESSIFRRLPSVAPPDAAPLRVMPMASRPVFSCVTDELLAVIPSSAPTGRPDSDLVESWGKGE